MMRQRLLKRNRNRKRTRKRTRKRKKIYSVSIAQRSASLRFGEMTMMKTARPGGGFWYSKINQLLYDNSRCR